MSLSLAAGLALGAVVYIGLILGICRLLSFALGDIDHE